MKVEGKIFVENRLIRQTVVVRDDPSLSFVRELELCLLDVCHQMEIPVPMWLSKNTHEFAAFRQTMFFRDQYTEEVSFDRFQIKMI